MAIPVYGGVQMNTTTRRMVKLIETYYSEHREVYVTSAIRSGSGSYHNGITYGSSTGWAVDFGAYDDPEPNHVDQQDMGKLADWIFANFWDLTIELIHTQPHNNHFTYVKNQRMVGAYATADHVNHIHWATSSALLSQMEARAKARWGSGSSTPASPTPTRKDLHYYRMHPYTKRPALANGDSGPAVGYLQRLLRDATGAQIDDVSGYPYGPQTTGAMLTFQKTLDLTEDSKVTDKDWERLEETLGVVVGKEKPALSRGSVNRWTGYLQHVLRKYEGHAIDNLHGFPFGPQTEKAVKAFQKKHSLSPDGKVGSKTWAKLDARMNKELDAAKDRKNKPAPPTPTPTKDLVFGWDASDFDWDRGARPSTLNKAANEGIQFFTHKVTEKASNGQWVHQRCGTMLQAAINAGVPYVGAYIVVRTPGPSVSDQVTFAIEELTKQWSQWSQYDGFFWQVDLEKWPYDEVAASHGVLMCQRLREMTNRAAILYAPRWAYGDTIPGNDPLWNSDYRGSGASRPFKTQWADVESSTTNQGFNTMSGRTPVILQYASDAVIGGQAPSDANVFRGALEQFGKLVERPTNTSPEPGPTVINIEHGDKTFEVSIQVKE